MRQNLDKTKIADIVFDDLDRWLDRFDIADVYRRGPNVYARCPVHDGDNPTGFSLSTEYKNWRCWTHDCHVKEAGIVNLTKLLLQKEDPNANFGHAVKCLTDLYSLEGFTVATTQQPTNETQRLVNMFTPKPSKESNIVIDQFSTIGSSPYFESRGFSPETLKFFGVEDCNDWSSKHYNNRATFPIADENGEIVTYMGRATKDWMVPKFYFPSGLIKSNYFYNMHNAKQRAEEVAALFLFEGQSDVWKMHEAGVHNCVGMFGKEIVGKQEELIMNMPVTTLIFAIDTDQPGKEARMKLQRQFYRYFNLEFPMLDTKDVGEMSVENIRQDFLPQYEGKF